jgi:hypothetical protein
MTITHRTILLSSLAAALAGCNSSGSGEKPADAQAFCQSAIRIEEAKLQSCDPSVAPPFVVPLLIDCQSFEAAQQADRIVYNQDQAAACLDALDAISCAEYGTMDITSFASLPAACRDAMAPQVASGGACYSTLGYECLSGYCDLAGGIGEACFTGGTCRDIAAPGADCSALPCGPGYSCSGGTCVANPPITFLGAGGDCSVVDTVCQDPYYCDAGTCVARKVVGADCGRQTECQLGLRCLQAPTGTCTAPLLAGAECSGGDCDAGLYCNDESVCAPYPHVGESCVYPQSEDALWCVDSWCDAGAEEPTCQPYREIGAPCSLISEEELFLSCGPGYLCLPTDLASGDYGICGRLYCPIYF